jgi:hypothetical protein
MTENLTNIDIIDKAYWITNKNYYSMQSNEKFINYFLSFIDFNDFKNSNTKKNIVTYGIQDTSQYDITNNDNINILICVENCNYWKHYKHFNLFGNYGDKKINIYIYNHISNFIKTQKYIVIPVIYLQIDYFLNFYNSIKPTKYIPWINKKDCLIVSVNKTHNNLNSKINAIINNFKCDHIKNLIELKNLSCYHSIELLNTFNSYKFIICFENSLSDGYITEKIFNVFFSRSIPVYLGPNDVFRYFNSNNFIDLRGNIDEIIKKMNNLNNEDSYINYINNPKINSAFDNENYKQHSIEYIKSLLSL